MSGPDPIRRLRAWQRFHLRITAVYAGVVFVALTVAAGLAYQLAWQATLEGLQGRMAIAVRGAAAGIDAERLSAADPEHLDPALVEQARVHLLRIADGEASLASMYVLLHDPDPRRLVFLVDVDRVDPTGAAVPGERYDASELPVLLQGFREPSVEQELYEDAWGPSLSAYAPVTAADGAPLAVVGVDVRVAELAALRRRVLLGTIGTWALAALLTGAAALYVGRNVRDPLTRVIDATAAIARGAFDTRLRLRRDDEFGLMAQHFDLMAEGLEERDRIRDAFGRFMAPEVARRLLGEGGSALGGEVREVTVLFADLRGYSTISEVLTPPQIVALLNRWLTDMVQVIDAEQGTLIEFLGDAVLVAFGAPGDLPAAPGHAIRAALGMQRAMDRLNEALVRDGLAEAWQGVGMDRLGMRIGVHTGPVVAGNVGAETRLTYTVIGDAVNVAARLEALNKPLGTWILASAATVALLPPGIATLVDQGEHAVKGRAEAVRVYEVREG